jgi:hypothetical protein
MASDPRESAAPHGPAWVNRAKRLRELMDDPDPAKVRRVPRPLLKMVKLDIAPLEAAAQG